MERLKFPPKDILMNSLSLSDLGVYVDEDDAKAVLSFRKHGVNIPCFSVANMATLIGSVPANSALPTGIKLSKTATDDGIYKAMLLEFKAPARDEDINYPYGITIRKRVQHPGVKNPQTNYYEKSYARTQPVVNTSNGYVTDAFKLIMENHLIDDITNDLPDMSQNTNSVTNFSGSIVTAKRAYKITLTNANTDKILLTPNADTGDAAETIDLDGGTTIITAVADFNDDNTIGAKAYAISSTEIVIVGAAGYKFVAADGGGASTVTIDTRYILLQAKDEEVQFSAIFAPETWEQQGFNLFSFTLAALTAQVTKRRLVVDGTKKGAAATVATTPVAFAAELTADGGGIGHATVEGTGVGTSALVVNYLALSGYEGIKAVNIVVDLDSSAVAARTTVTDTYKCTGAGQYPTLSPDEVFSKFFNQANQGRLSNQVRLDQPIANVDYYKYYIKFQTDANAEHEASGSIKYNGIVNLYVLKSAADALVWDLSEGLYVDAATTPDLDLDLFLSYWSDNYVSEWKI